MDSKTSIKYTHRFLAQIVIEAVTPLAVGSGETDILTDSLVATDSNGLPYIPGTAIAGVLRSMTDSSTKLFGGKTADDDDGKGSEIIFTDAKILNHDGKVIDGLSSFSAIQSDELLKHYQELPIRQHVRISHRGVNDKAGKFDEQIVYAGTRFCFEIEMISDGENKSDFMSVLQLLRNKRLRLGGGSRRGFGKIKVADVRVLILDLRKENDLSTYLNKTSALNTEFWDKYEAEAPGNNDNADSWTTYTLSLTPESFFLFGSGFGDDEADMTPVKAKKVNWKNNKGNLEENLVLIPATSLKGALSHRVAYHWNRIKGIYADDLSSDELKTTGENNQAVKALFGSHENESSGAHSHRGNVIFSDVIEKLDVKDKILNHVSIDRFMGGAIDGALFSEKATYGAGKQFELSILVDLAGVENICKNDLNDVIQAFESALRDLCRGLLPLGGGVNRGHGSFTGSLMKNEELIYEYKDNK